MSGSYLTSRAFWAATAERATSTAAQTAAATIGATALVHEIQWVIVGSASAGAGLLSVLKAIAAGAATGTASLTGAEQPAGSTVLHDGSTYDPRRD